MVSSVTYSIIRTSNLIVINPAAVRDGIETFSFRIG